MFKPHYGICVECRRDNVVIAVKKGYCQICNEKQKKAQKADKTSKPYLAPLSDKRAKEQRLYLIARKLYLKHHPLCKVKVHGCHLASAEVHHMKGRTGKLYLDQAFWLPVCSPCHKYVETHPEEAKEKGWSVSRLVN